MQNQSLQLAAAAPTLKLFFYNTADGTPATVAFGAAGLTLAYARDNGANVNLTLVTATLGTWVSSGFIVRGGGIHELYLPVAANASGAKALTIVPVSLPTGISMIPCVVPLFADDVSAAAPTVGDFINALRAENTGSAWGVTSQPVGGATVTYSERRAVGGTLGTRTAYYDSTGKLAGLTAVV